MCAEFEKAVKDLAPGVFDVKTDINTYWNKIKKSLLNACDKVCGSTRGGIQIKRETWWWNDSVNEVIKEKRRLWKEWQNGGDKEKYLVAKRKAKATVYATKKKAQGENLCNLESSHGKNYIFKLAKRMKYENVDISGDSCVKDDAGNLVFDDKGKLEAWRRHYDRLLNIEFSWNKDALSEQDPIQGPPIWITEGMVSKSMNSMKKGKAAGPSGIISEMILGQTHHKSY